MADTAVTQTIQDGGRTAIIKTTVVIGAGSPPPPQEVTLVDVSALAVDPITKRACNSGAGKNGDIVALSQANAATPLAPGDTYTFILTVTKTYG